MPTRRDILKTGLFTLSPSVPWILQRSAFAAQRDITERKLVVIQLTGGNDGLNTLIPHKHDEYHRSRSQLRIRSQDVLKLNDELGLHPAMRAAADLFNEGRLAIVPGVGYPNPDRSHFRSMAIWHSAHPDAANQQAEYGWLGRTADQFDKRPSSVADSIFVGDASIPNALVGQRSVAISLDEEQELHLKGKSRHQTHPASGDELTDFVRNTMKSSLQAAESLKRTDARVGSSYAPYPTTRLGMRLQLLARLIRIDLGARFFYVEQSGYDTHSAQLFVHERLLRELSDALSAFLDDLRGDSLDEQVVVMAFSEFGRRVAENGSAGTDHGTAGPVFVAGNRVQPGLHGTYPSLTELDQEGDLLATVDFRSIYQSVLQHGLAISPDRISANNGSNLQLFRAG